MSLVWRTWGEDHDSLPLLFENILTQKNNNLMENSQLQYVLFFVDTILFPTFFPGILSEKARSCYLEFCLRKYILVINVKNPVDWTKYV
jgi:hypothetical protein